MDIVTYPMMKLLHQIGDGRIPDRVEFGDTVVTVFGDKFSRVRVAYKGNLLFGAEYTDQDRLNSVMTVEICDDLNYVLQSIKEYARDCELGRLRARIKELEETEL